MKKRAGVQTTAIVRFITRLQQMPAGTEDAQPLPEGGRIVGRRSPAPGIALVAETVDAPHWSKHEIFEPADSPAPDYPPDLPFLPHAGVTVMRSVVGLHASLFVAWSGLRRPRSAAGALIEQSTRAGWAVTGTIGVWPVIPAITSLERGDEKRSISALHEPTGTVLLQSTARRASR